MMICDRSAIISDILYLGHPDRHSYSHNVKTNQRISVLTNYVINFPEPILAVFFFFINVTSLLNILHLNNDHYLPITTIASPVCLPLTPPLASIPL